jgi:hypothetical protein
MPTDQEKLAQIQQSLETIQKDVFFKKLASYAIAPKNDAEAKDLWSFGCRVMDECPLQSKEGLQVKQASCNELSDAESVIPENGYSPDAIKVAEWLLQQPKFTDAARFMLTRSQA